MLKQVLAGVIACVCITEAVLNFANASAAIAWAIASAGWIPHMFDNRIGEL